MASSPSFRVIFLRLHLFFVLLPPPALLRSQSVTACRLQTLSTIASRFISFSSYLFPLSFELVSLPYLVFMINVFQSFRFAFIILLFVILFSPSSLVVSGFCIIILGSMLSYVSMVMLGTRCVDFHNRNTYLTL